LATSVYRPELSNFQRWLLFATAVFPASLYVGAQTIANAVLPQMQGDLAAGIDQVSWVVTASGVAGAIGIPPTAWLANRFGRRRMMMVAMIGFGTCSLLVGFMDSLAGVVVFRALSAFLGAPAVALSQTVTLDLFEERQRGAAFAFWAIGILTGWIMAPSVGAYLSELESWRLIFWVLGPVAALGAMSASLMPDSEKMSGSRFDWFGFLAFSMALSSFLIIVNRGQRVDWFESSELWFWLLSGLLSLYVFIVHVWTSDAVFLRWRIFRDRNYAIGVIIVFVYAYLSLAPLVLVPTFLKQIRGLELLTTGLVLVPRGLAQMVGLILVGRFVNSIEPRMLSGIGFVLFTVSSWQIAGFTIEVGLWDLLIPNLIQGFAMALIWVPIANMTYANLPMNLRADAATMVSLLYSIASSLGVSIAVTILSRTAQINHEEVATHVVPWNEALRLPEYAAFADLSSLTKLAVLNAQVAQQSLMIAYTNTFTAMGLFALVVCPLVVLLRKPKLNSP
jgi:DHA2 family multidrug resistance protein